LLSRRLLTPELVEEAKHAPGIDPAQMGACLSSGRPDEVLEEAIDLIKQTDFVGLPTTYIGARRLLGAQPKEAYLEALAEASQGSTFSGVSPRTYWLLVLLLCLVIGFASRSRTQSALEGVGPTGN
jgi:hypothetical protein